jgi:hypothetical protein
MKTGMENRFDELAKALAGGVSRREVMRRLGLWVAGGTVAALGLATQAEAAVGTVTSSGECRQLCSSGCPKPKGTVSSCTHTCQACFSNMGGTSFTLESCSPGQFGWTCT